MAEWCEHCRRVGFIVDTFGLPAEEIRTDSIPDLHRAARDWRESGYPDPRPHLRDTLLQGKNLWEILTAKRVDVYAVDFIGSRLLLDRLKDRQVHTCQWRTNESGIYYHADCGESFLALSTYFPSKCPNCGRIILRSQEK